MLDPTDQQHSHFSTLRALIRIEWQKKKKEKNNFGVYSKDGRLTVEPFDYRCPHRVTEWLRQSDDFIRSNFSTSPAVEPAHFAQVRTRRRARRSRTKNPTWQLCFCFLLLLGFVVL